MFSCAKEMKCLLIVFDFLTLLLVLFGVKREVCNYLTMWS